ncbi:DUF2231 domain-containing protein [Sphingomonas sp. JC676]|uniref:DUF2231 domain-containing protein n=1 Tax=Sphingomonas sp. JC676 TaxID=2768065 RepID=UPI001657A5B7|nr:DUF2231 domain-containing protein [Sphingomonas sp. JC676]MBC9033892.1 DUF2231 domain-containing protein [Sphingomonas sp. JC676]
MTEQTPRSIASIAGRPIHPMTVALPIALFVATFSCDGLFYLLHDPILATAAYYALAAGILLGVLAALFGFIDYYGSREIRNLKAANIHLIGNVFILVLSAFNLMLRYGAVNGLPLACFILSAIVFVGIHVTGWMGWTMVYRHGVGVTAGKAGE